MVHLAAIADPEYRPAAELFAHNTAATMTVLWTAAEHGIRRLVIASSSNATGLLLNQRHVRPDRYPTFAFCSMRCLKLGAAMAKRNRGMIDKTELEIRAIKAARRNFAEALMELDLMGPFHSRSAEEIDRIIEACVDAFSESMKRQALNDEIPF